MNSPSLKIQVCRMLNDKIARICSREYRRSNPRPVPIGKQSKPYRVPQEAQDMVEMLGKIETATNAELEQMAAFAGSAQVLQLSHAA